MNANTDFVHRFLPGDRPDSPVLLLLHGTGGNEDDLVWLGQSLLPGAAILSPRGKVLENRMPRFFRRLAEGVFDLPDLKFRTQELSAFLASARERYGLKDKPVVAVGYSNGANIAASLLFTQPHDLAGAILFRAMLPFHPKPLPDLKHVSLFLGAGERDTIVPKANISVLAQLFEAAGADVSLHWHSGGHELGDDDLAAARHWLQKAFLHGKTAGSMPN